MSIDLATIAADPSRIENVGADALPALIGEAEMLRARLWAQLQTRSAPPPLATPTANGGPDRMLTVAETAERIGVAARWVYRHANTLPFAKRLPGGSLRFSERGLERWKESRSTGKTKP